MASVPDYTLRHWWNAHKQCFPEDLQQRAYHLLMEHGVEWMEKLCTIEGEFELWNRQLNYEAASQLLLVIRHRGFGIAEQYCGRECSAEETQIRARIEKERRERREMEDKYGRA